MRGWRIGSAVWNVCDASTLYNGRVTRQKHYYGLNHLRFLTRSTYRRASDHPKAGGPAWRLAVVKLEVLLSE